MVERAIGFLISLLWSAKTTIGTAFGEEEIAFGGISKSYHTRVTNGSTGETITLSIKYGRRRCTNWYAGLVYQDSITVTLAAN